MKQYKCAFNHCAHPDCKVSQEEAVKVGSRYWHRDCYEISELVKQIRDSYYENISSTAVGSFLMKVINDIVYGKKMENKKVSKSQSNLEAARYLEFAIDYAIKHEIPITHIPGLYYLIDNTKIKKAYEKEKELTIQKEMKKSMDKVDVESKPIDTTVKNDFPFSSGGVGFGNIIKGGNKS